MGAVGLAESHFILYLAALLTILPMATRTLILPWCLFVYGYAAAYAFSRQAMVGTVIIPQCTR